MARTDSGRADPKEPGRLRGVTELPTVLGEQRSRAWIGRGKGRKVNLGVYPSRWLAAFAYNVAAEALHGPRGPKNEIPREAQPDAEQVRLVTARVRTRLGLDPAAPGRNGRPPEAEEIRTFFEVTVIGYWRGQASGHDERPGKGLDIAARRLVEAANLLYWNRESGLPSLLEVMEGLLSVRLDRAFRRSDLTWALLDDDGDDEFRMARWLVYPDALPGGPGFRDAVAYLYEDLVGPPSARAEASEPFSWAAVLGIRPPFSSEQVRSAYRARSKAVHPDSGGSPEEFVRLRSAYEEARRYCKSSGV